MILLAAKRVLGLSVDEFWHLTPAVFHALLNIQGKISDDNEPKEKQDAEDEIGW